MDKKKIFKEFVEGFRIDSRSYKIDARKMDILSAYIRNVSSDCKIGIRINKDNIERVDNYEKSKVIIKIIGNADKEYVLATATAEYTAKIIDFQTEEDYKFLMNAFNFIIYDLIVRDFLKDVVDRLSIMSGDGDYIIEDLYDKMDFYVNNTAHKDAFNDESDDDEDVINGGLDIAVSNEVVEKLTELEGLTLKEVLPYLKEMLKNAARKDDAVLLTVLLEIATLAVDTDNGDVKFGLSKFFSDEGDLPFDTGDDYDESLYDNEESFTDEENPIAQKYNILNNVSKLFDDSEDEKLFSALSDVRNEKIEDNPLDKSKEHLGFPKFNPEDLN